MAGRRCWWRGSWVLKLGRYTSPPVRLVRVEDAPHGPLDRLYKTDHRNPQRVIDYPDDANAELVDDAPERLVAWLVKGEENRERRREDAEND